MLTVCASSTDPYLASTGAVKDELRTTSTADDARLSDLILRASAWAEQYVGYPLGLGSYQESLPSYGGLRLSLERTPVRKVFRLFDATDTGSASEFTSTEYRLEDPEAGFISRDEGFRWTGGVTYALEPAYAPGSELAPWLCDYAAGYTLAGTTSTDFGGTTSTGRTLPHDIEQAVAIKAAEWFRGDDGVASKRVGDLQVSYKSDPGQLGRAERLLAPYRRI